MKQFYVPLAVSAAVLIAFAVHFALGQTTCPPGYTLTAGRCVQNSGTGGGATGATGSSGPTGATGPAGASGPAGPAPLTPANMVIAGPTGGASAAAAPRALVAADIPALAYVPTLANVAIGPANATISGTLNIKDATPTTGATIVNIALGAGQTATQQTFANTGGFATGPTNYYGTVSGTSANNALVVTATLTPVEGSCLTLSLGSFTLQAGANTLNVNGTGVQSIYSHFAPGTAIAKAYAANSFIQVCQHSGFWFDMSQ